MVVVVVVDHYHQVVVVVTDTFQVVIDIHFHVLVHLFAVVVVILLTHVVDREAIHLVDAVILVVEAILVDVAIHVVYQVEEAIHHVVVIQEAEAMIVEIIHHVARAEAFLLLLVDVVVEAFHQDVDSYLAIVFGARKSWNSIHKVIKRQMESRDECSFICVCDAISLQLKYADSLSTT